MKINLVGLEIKSDLSDTMIPIERIYFPQITYESYDLIKKIKSDLIE